MPSVNLKLNGLGWVPFSFPDSSLIFLGGFRCENKQYLFLLFFCLREEGVGVTFVSYVVFTREYVM